MEDDSQRKDEKDELIDMTNDDSVDDMTWLYFPRAGNTFGARFELPIDLRKLKSKYAVIF